MTDEKRDDAPQTQSLQKRDLPEAVVRRGIDEGAWNTLCRTLYPGANPNSVLLVWDYCKARKLDPMKKPCHIVPMEVKDAKTGRYEWRDVVLPGVYEYRTTAHRTGEYLGHSEPAFGPEKEHLGVVAPEWCSMTVYRWNAKAQSKVGFPVQVFFSEVVATKRDKETREIAANARWSRAPKQMLVKCTEAAGIREAFPEEIGGEPTAEEMDGQRASAHTDDADVIDVEAVVTPDSLLAKVPEGLRDNIGMAFETLGLTEGQRSMLINEHLGGSKDAEGGATALLEILRADYKKRQAEKKAGAGNNGKAAPKPVGAGSTVKDPTDHPTGEPKDITPKDSELF